MKPYLMDYRLVRYANYALGVICVCILAALILFLLWVFLWLPLTTDLSQ
jgi:hypothetical protein